MIKKLFSKDSLKGSFHILYHVAVIALSASIAFSLPYIVRYISRNFSIVWLFIESKTLYLVSMEIVIALLLILFLNYIYRSLIDRRYSNMARSAGMVNLFPSRGFFSRWRIKKLKEKHGYARDIMIIGSTGFSTFVDPKGDLYNVVQNCREAKIMLLNPYGEGAKIRASCILDPDVTVEKVREQTIKSIDFLKGLKAVRKNIKIKLYEDEPFLKLAMLGDYVWIKHYHPAIDVQTAPEYVFEHDQNPLSLYTHFYQYLMMRWNNSDIPEYDLDTDELVYRGTDGNEIKRQNLIKSGPC